MGCGPCACHGGCQWFIAKICLQALFVGVVRYDGRDLNSADNAMVSEEEACHIAVRIKKQKELSLLTK